MPLVFGELPAASVVALPNRLDKCRVPSKRHGFKLKHGGYKSAGKKNSAASPDPSGSGCRALEVLQVPFCGRYTHPSSGGASAALSLRVNERPWYATATAAAPVPG